MRPKAVSLSRVLERVVTTSLVLLLFPTRNVATSNDVIMTDGDDSDESPKPVNQGNTRTNEGRYNGNGQPESGNATHEEISLKELQERYQRIVRDREIWKNIIIGRVWGIRHHLLSIPEDFVNPRDATDLQAFESYVEVEHNDDREDTEESNTCIHSPQCSGPRNFTGTWNDGTSFRLYFKVESIETSHLLHETKVNSAFLCIKRKPSLDFGSHRPAVNSGKTGRPRAVGTDAGTVSSGRAPHHRRRPTRGSDETVSSSTTTSRSFSSFPSSPSSSRSDVDGGLINNLKIIVNSFSRANKKSRQEMRIVSMTTVPRHSSEWIRIDVTHVVDDWMKRPSRNLGLQVTLVNDGSLELNPEEYFEGINCSTSTDQSFSLEEPTSQSVIDRTRTHLNNTTHPFLEVVTVEVPRSRPRHRRDLKTDSSSDNRIEAHSDDTERSKYLMLRKWLQGLKSSDDDSSSNRARQHLSDDALKSADGDVGT